LDSLRTFEGDDLRDVLTHVRGACGPDATIVEVVRSRRGGVGGFFARPHFQVSVSDATASTPLPPVAPEASSTASIPGEEDTDLADAHHDDITATTLEIDCSPAEVEAAAEAEAGTAPDAELDEFSARFAAELALALDELDADDSPESAPAPAPAPSAGTPAAAEPERQLVAVGATAVASARCQSESATILGPLSSAPSPPARLLLGPDELARGPRGRGPSAGGPTSGSGSPGARHDGSDVDLGALHAHRARLRDVSAPSTAGAGEPDDVDLWTLLDRFAALTPPDRPNRARTGRLAVIGPHHLSIPVARAHAGDCEVLVVTRHHIPDLPARQIVDDDPATTHLAGLTRDRRQSLVVAIDASSSVNDLAWARRVAAAIGARQRHLVVPSHQPVDEVRAVVELLTVTALDLVDVAADADPEAFCAIGIPVTTVEGHAASPALWAALALERRSHAR
jgi:hypothetical protein